MKTKLAILFGAVLLCVQAYGGPLVGEWTIKGGLWYQFPVVYPGPVVFHARGPSYDMPSYEVISAELVNTVEVEKGVFLSAYTNALVYLYAAGPWVGCVPPPGSTPKEQYFKIWLDSMTMTVIVTASGYTQTVAFVLVGKDGELRGGGPGFKASITISGTGGTGSGGMGEGWIGIGTVDSATIAITGPVLDIKPGSEDNPVNVNSRGVIPVAVYGADQAVFDNPMAFALAGAKPLRYDFEGGVFNLIYDTQEVVANLGPVQDGQDLDVKFGYTTTVYFDGNIFKVFDVLGCDSIKVLKKGK